jgi:MFS family permease
VLIPISGWVADRFGSRSVFATAVGVFTLSSLLCGLSHTLTQFTLMRILQGLGGAMMVPVGCLIVLRHTPKDQLTQAIAYMTWPGLTALVLGPALGGLITTYASWHWIFFLNLTLGLLAFTLTLLWVENVRTGEQHPSVRKYRGLFSLLHRQRKRHPLECRSSFDQQKFQLATLQQMPLKRRSMFQQPRPVKTSFDPYSISVIIS